MHIVLAVEKINNTHGSMERTVANLANFLTKINHQVTILTFDENNNGAPVYPISHEVKSYNLELIESNSYKQKFAERSDIKQHMPKVISGIISNISAIKRIFSVSKKEVPIVAQALKRISPDVVVSFQSHFHRYIVPAAKQAGIPVIASEHKPPMSLYKEHVSMVDRIVIFSCLKIAEKVRVLLPEFSEDYPANIRGKCVAIPNGIILKEMDHNEEGEHKEITTKTIISVGESHMKKYYETLIHSFARIASDFPEWHLKIFGNVDRNSKLENLIVEYDLEDQIFLMGETDNMKERYENAEIYAMPSLFRGFSNVILEAISAGLPIVAVNDVTSNPVKVVEDGLSGVLVPTKGNNVKNLAGGLSMLMNDDALRKSMSEATVEKAAYFDMDKILKQWEELLVSCCK